MKKETIDKIVDRLDRLSPTELRQVFTRMAAERGLLEDVFDALHDGVVLFNTDGKASFANKSACNIYGRSKRELLQESFETLSGGTCDWHELLESGIAITRDLQVNYPEKRHYNFFMTPISGGEEYLLLVQDDTELRAKDAADAEAEQMNLLSFLASGVAHELGNPINSLGLNLQVMERKLAKMPAEYREMIEPLLKNSLNETKRLDTLIRQFLQSMRPSTLQREVVDIHDCISRVLDVLSAEIADRGIGIQEAFSEKLPELQADDAQLFQVFYNLIRNAYQSIAGPDGGILIQTDFNDRDIIIRISDSGTGISHELMGSLYEPFRTTKKNGNGLGLLIVRRIINDHGGSLAIASKEGTGTTVTINLPRADRVTRLLPSA